MKCSFHHSENPCGWTYSNWEKAALSSKEFNSFKVYIIECYNDNEKFIKIGRTFRILERRFSGKNMPYNYTIIKEFIFDDARECCEYEAKLKKENKQYKYKPLIDFRGKEECFNLNIYNGTTK